MLISNYITMTSCDADGTGSMSGHTVLFTFLLSEHVQHCGSAPLWLQKKVVLRKASSCGMLEKLDAIHKFSSKSSQDRLLPLWVGSQRMRMMGKKTKVFFGRSSYESGNGVSTGSRPFLSHLLLVLSLLGTQLVDVCVPQSVAQMFDVAPDSFRPIPCFSDVEGTQIHK